MERSPLFLVSFWGPSPEIERASRRGQTGFRIAMGSDQLRWDQTRFQAFSRKTPGPGLLPTPCLSLLRAASTLRRVTVYSMDIGHTMG